MQLPSPLGPSLSLPQPFVTSAFASIGGAKTTTAPANITNSDNTTPQPCLFSVPVVSGAAFTIEFVLMFDTGANLNGLTIALTHPGVTNGTVRTSANTTGLATVAGSTAAITASPMALAFGGGIPGAYGGRVYVSIIVSGVASATGTVDITFRPVTNTNLMTLLAGSIVRT